MSTTSLKEAIYEFIKSGDHIDMLDSNKEFYPNATSKEILSTIIDLIAEKRIRFTGNDDNKDCYYFVID